MDHKHFTDSKYCLGSKQDQVVNKSGLEKIYALTDGRTDIQKSDLYSEVALAKNCSIYIYPHLPFYGSDSSQPGWIFHPSEFQF